MVPAHSFRLERFECHRLVRLRGHVDQQPGQGRVVGCTAMALS